MHLLQEWFDALGFLIDLALRLSLFLFAVAAVVLIFGRKKEAVTEISLHNLSKLWTKEGTNEIHISKLSPLWRDEKTNAEPDVQLPDLQNPRAAAFINSVLQGPFFKKLPSRKPPAARS